MSFTSPKKQGVAQPKQIRFVSTDGQPQTKRRRVNAACGTCRKRKIRCSGEQPVCKTCINYKHKCLGYNDPPNVQPPPAAAPPVQRESRSQSPGGRKSPSPRSKRSDLSSKIPDSNPPAPEQEPTLTTKETQARHARDVDSGFADSPESNRSALISSDRTHVPYFRYFGPTAIVPGFKQMVVRVREARKSNNSYSDSTSSARSSKAPEGGDQPSSAFTDSRLSHSIPFYDPEDNLPVSGLITHLCEVFFTHLGCNFPFLQRDRFLRDLSDKQVEPILVDAVCALAARFSLHPLLATNQSQPNEPITGSTPESKHARQGHLFAQRAMCAIVNAFSCPTLAVVQACLLLAYEEFGSNRDSGLWMYLGICIRMAQDLGLQKLEGMKYKYGCVGLTPKSVKAGQMNKFNGSGIEEPIDSTGTSGSQGKNSTEHEHAKQRERVDSFWSIFFLDRVISSGTGRPVTLRDDDIEIYFPLQSESALHNGWPAPFPPLMRIIHLYGRITDFLNAINEVNHVTPDTLRMLAGMESDLTGIYQRLSVKLHFNAVNFQNYVKAGEGTNFILLHFWFHTLIVLLHQPTLLHSFGGKIQQLFPNSRELSMSSAKTIADILAFAELIDAKSFIGNPFTSQPIYVAACAFLMESAHYSLPPSRPHSPPTNQSASSTSKYNPPAVSESQSGNERSSNAKHTLLASAAKDNYQRCYKALKSLEVYWEGIKYILTVLDQKSKGVWDPQLYTDEEMGNTADLQAGGTGLPPGWKRTVVHGVSERPPSKDEKSEDSSELAPQNTPADTSPRIDPSQAIGWALTGATNSSQPNVSFLYQLPGSQPEANSRNPTSFAPQYGDGYQSLSTSSNHQTMASYNHLGHLSPNGAQMVSPHDRPSVVTSAPRYSPLSSSMAPESNLRLALDSTYPTSSQQSGPSQRNYQNATRNNQLNTTGSYGYDVSSAIGSRAESNGQTFTSDSLPGHVDPETDLGHGLTIESQEVDMNALHDQTTFPYSLDGEFLPWLEYLPQDVLHHFEYHPNYRLMNPDTPNPDQPPSV